MESIAVLDLGDGRRIHCKGLEEATSKWAQNYSGIEEATIDVFFKVGLGSVVVTYRYDGEAEKWVKAK
ncbi:hypothetical protein KUW17_01300 [Leisingera aquaemixtae]|uniref:hypothetical protein n=1 Tax=Leisingera TaxID=191028 RepID=UPI001C96FF2D|nr:MULTISPECIES: hypothetical protein [Leisingera]MBY6065360.1 hypothetical protein [Leisingera aquaemixtae]MCB4454421.1 hypothetical protein [Leisingera sp. McT4-56]